MNQPNQPEQSTKEQLKADFNKKFIHDYIPNDIKCRLEEARDWFIKHYHQTDNKFDLDNFLFWYKSKQCINFFDGCNNTYVINEYFKEYPNEITNPQKALSEEEQNNFIYVQQANKKIIEQQEEIERLNKEKSDAYDLGCKALLECQQQLSDLQWKYNELLKRYHNSKNF